MIVVLRLSHRRERDKRISTHVGLVARALGANKLVYSGEQDDNYESSINKVVENWGGNFGITYEKNAEKVISFYKKKRFTVVHLTMYGSELEKDIKKIRKCKDLLVIVGGEKVPGEVYKESDFNISVTNQPHSEVAALALFLDRYFKGKEMGLKFKNAKLRIKPNPKGKSFY
ncbi:tRNA (cytidine(56)-2'-O)-methyltransferase [Candidatus Tiddalikarchaeum anstoanum]|nr:tRNA (cytidine(56)-2'-O)-methyltransferase [Candidatus Tiddalikarchaeum anstoanum]